MGSAAKAGGTYSTAIGNDSSAADADSVSIGRGVTSHGLNTFNIRPTKLENIYLGDNTLKSLTDTLYGDKTYINDSSQTTHVLSADKFYFMSHSNTTVSLSFADSDWQTNCKEYDCAIEVLGGGISLSVPASVKWCGAAPSMKPGKTYLLSFYNGYCAWGMF